MPIDFNAFAGAVCGIKPVKPAPAKLPPKLSYRNHEIRSGAWPYGWEWAHEDYDGAPDAGDSRCGVAKSMRECIDQIDESLAESRPDLCVRCHHGATDHYIDGGCAEPDCGCGRFVTAEDAAVARSLVGLEGC